MTDTANEPAFHIVLEDEELIGLGEISVIQGHIKACMLLTVKRLLDVSMDLARQLLGSTKMETNATIWRDTIRAKCQDPSLRAMGDNAFELFRDLTRGRNDFIHAVYVTQMGKPEDLFLFPNPGPAFTGPTVAYRSRDPDKKRHASEIAEVRQKAARLSRIVAHILWTINRDVPTPWHDRL